jgi:hypothetical protein
MSEDHREIGVEFGDLADALESHEYPVTGDELVAAHGGATIRLQNEDRTFEDVIAPVAEQTFEDPEEVRQTVFNMVGEEAVGRQRYSDRGGEPREDRGEDESL